MRLRKPDGSYDPAHERERYEADEKIKRAINILAAAGLNKSEITAFIFQSTHNTLSMCSIIPEESSSFL